jgi:hypothetical protein
MKTEKKYFQLLKVIGQGWFGTEVEGVVKKENVIIKCLDVDDRDKDKEIYFFLS